MVKRVIVSLGGSIIIPKKGFDPKFLKSFRSLIISEIKKGKSFLFIVGGGSTCRIYQRALLDTVAMTSYDLDLMGIATTKINAEFVRLLFKDFAYKECISDPAKRINTTKPVIVATGWKPGNSTDFCAVRFAKTFASTNLINLSNIEYVYDKDPSVYSDAKKIEEISWKDFRKIVGNTWNPGANLPFDPIASKEAEKLKLQVSILCGTDLKEVKNAIEGKKFRGTKISSLSC